MKSNSALTVFGLATTAALAMCLAPSFTPSLLAQAPAAKAAAKTPAKASAPASSAAKAAPKAATTTGKSAFDKPTFEAYLRHMEAWVPQISVVIDDPKPSKYLDGFSEVTVHISYQGQGKDERYYVSKDGRNVLKGDAFNINKNPFQANLDTLNTDKQPSYGTPGAPVVLVVFGDFECPVCKAEADVMRANLVKTYGEKVRVYFKDFPLESIHPWARAASVAGRCVFRQNAETFWKFHDWIYQVQETINPENLNAQVNKWAATAGVDPIQLSRCIDNKATDPEVAANMKEGMALGIDGTPTTFLNGRKIPGIVQWDTLSALIGLELDHQSKFADAGDKPCEAPAATTCTIGPPTLLPGKK